MIDEVLKILMVVVFGLIILCALCVLINEMCDCLRSDDEEEFIQE